MKTPRLTLSALGAAFALLGIATGACSSDAGDTDTTGGASGAGAARS